MPDVSENALEAITKGQLKKLAHSTAGLIGDIAAAAAQDIEEIENAKQDKINSVSITIPATGWNADSNTDYPKYYDINVNGITAKDRAVITIAVNSLKTAKTCGMCNTNETLSGKIRIRAAKVPANAILAEYIIEKGAN